MGRRGRSKLSADLYETSQTFARTAMVASNMEEHSVFLLHSATALEQLSDILACRSWLELAS